jgi:hypothetical protein
VRLIPLVTSTTTGAVVPAPDGRIIWSIRWNEKCQRKPKYSEKIYPSVTFFFHWLYSPLGPWPLISQFHDHFSDGKTPWTSDQLVTRPLPKHRTTQIQNKHIHTPNIHALCGIRTHDLGFRASLDSSCPRPLGYRDLLSVTLPTSNSTWSELGSSRGRRSRQPATNRLSYGRGPFYLSSSENKCIKY